MKNTDVTPILKNRTLGEPGEPMKGPKFVRMTFPRGENIVKLNSQQFTIDSEIKLALEYNNLFAVLFYKEKDIELGVFDLWHEFEDLGGIILGAMNLDYETQYDDAIKEITIFHPFSWIKPLVTPYIIIYNEGWPQGSYTGKWNYIEIKKFLELMKQRDFAFRREGNSFITRVEAEDKKLREEISKSDEIIDGLKKRIESLEFDLLESLDILKEYKEQEEEREKKKAERRYIKKQIAKEERKKIKKENRRDNKENIKDQLDAENDNKEKYIASVFSGDEDEEREKEDYRNTFNF